MDGRTIERMDSHILTRKAGTLFSLHLLLGLVGWQLYGQSTPIDAPSSWGQLVGTFLLFLFWGGGLFEWGRGLAKLAWPTDSFFMHMAGALALGTAWGAWLSGLGFLFFPHFCSQNGAWLGFLFCLLGHFLPQDPLWPQRGPAASVDSRSPLSRWVARGLLGLLVGWNILIILRGAVLHPHGDAFVVYLLGPVQWAFERSPNPFFDNPHLFLMGSWEQLFLWPSVWLAQPPDQGLDAVQRFAQWTTSGLGIPGLFFALGALCQMTFPRSLSIIGLRVGILAGLTVPCLRSWVVLSKNDWNVSFWLLASLLPFFSYGKKPRLSWLFSTGVLWGAAVWGKPPYVLFCVALLLSTLGLWKRGSFLLACVALGGGGLLGAAPVLLRNLAWTHNPVYPWLQTLFPSAALMGPSLLAGVQHATEQEPVSLAQIVSYFWEAWTHSLWSLGLFLPWAWARFRIQQREDSRVALSLIAGLVLHTGLFSVFFRHHTEVRYLGPTLLLLSALGVLGLWQASTLVFQASYWQNRAPMRHFGFTQVLGSLILAGVISQLHLPLFTLLQLASPRYQPGSAWIQTHTAGKAKHWLRQHAQRTDPILSLGFDNEAYYLTGWQWRHLESFPRWDRQVEPLRRPNAEWDWPGILAWLAQEHIAWISVLKNDPRAPAVSFLKALAQAPHCRVYQDDSAEIFAGPCLTSQPF